MKLCLLLLLIHCMVNTWLWSVSEADQITCMSILGYEDVFISRFQRRLMLSLIQRARLIGQRAGPAPYREVDYNWWEFDNNNLLYIYTMCHRNSMGYQHFKSAPSDCAPRLANHSMGPHPLVYLCGILIFVVIFIAQHFFQFHALQQSFRQKTIVPR